MGPPLYNVGCIITHLKLVMMPYTLLYLLCSFSAYDIHPQLIAFPHSFPSSILLIAFPHSFPSPILLIAFPHSFPSPILLIAFPHSFPSCLSVFQIRPVGVTKGLAMQRILAVMAEECEAEAVQFDFVLCIGEWEVVGCGLTLCCGAGLSWTVGCSLTL
jgi:hypothetical protein